ncbi:MAG: SOS response-associated peptidase [Eubacteriales bacterium]|nr:SOS response-associated peptidase [Eubacteriales bacterium]
MCGTYYLGNETLRDIYKLVHDIDSRLRTGQINWSKDIHPTEQAPVITAGSNGGAHLSLQRWGYPGIQNKGVIFNARQESVWEKKMFDHGIRYHRAVIPADYFYEWNANKEKYTFRRTNRQPLFLAGFFDMLQNEERFVILTTEANASMSPVHDRMPVILEQEQWKDWLYDPSAARDIMRETPPLLDRDTPYEQMTLFQ